MRTYTPLAGTLPVYVPIIIQPAYLTESQERKLKSEMLFSAEDMKRNSRRFVSSDETIEGRSIS